MSFEEFQTILCIAKGIINSRPLYFDLTAQQWITPHHFLTGESPLMMPEWDTQDPDYRVLPQQLKRRSDIMHQFWSSWIRDYLTRIRQHHRLNGTDCLFEGQAVLVRTTSNYMD